MNKIIAMKNITKKFPGVVALEDINFDVSEGEVHVLLGENGAGKSTLMKILSGIYTPTYGNIEVLGNTYSKLTPALSKKLGITIINQELSVIDELSIIENVFLGNIIVKRVFGIPVVDYKTMEEKTKEVMSILGLNKDPYTFVEKLSISEKQLVEIAKAIVLDSKVIIMDEPTSSLTNEEVDNLFKVIKGLKKEKKGIVYISHKMDELKVIGDRVTVLKDGKYIGTENISTIDVNSLIKMMVGRELKSFYRSQVRDKNSCKEKILDVKNITRVDGKVKDISFELYKGEILGFAGLVGSGRTELLEAIFGAKPIRSGQIYYKDKEVINKSTYDAIKNGFALLTENRRQTGYMNNFSIKENITFVQNIKNSRFKGMFGKFNDKKNVKLAEEEVSEFDIRCRDIEQNILELSGGNQQKVIIGKWMAANQNILMFDEPTKGIDVGTKSEIYKIMRKLSDAGKAVLMVSSELPELLAVCDRIIVFSEGSIKGILPSYEATEERIIELASI